MAEYSSRCTCLPFWTSIIKNKGGEKMNEIKEEEKSKPSLWDYLAPVAVIGLLAAVVVVGAIVGPDRPM